MPRLKKSLGVVTFRSPFMPELQRYLMYELENSRRWNKKIITGGMIGANKWLYKSNFLENNWTISYTGETIVVSSNNPIIYLRKGLEINMGYGRIIIEP